MKGESATRGADICVGEYLETLRNCGGYYECAKDSSGKRRRPLVGYAGKYDGEHQWVGDVYYNFAKVEELPHVLDEFAKDLAEMIQGMSIAIDYILAAPMGGLAFGVALARHLNRRYCFAEKQITALATADSRERSELGLKRHELRAGSNVILVEDVCNNFSTTEQASDLVKAAGSNLVGIACELNRSK